MLKSIFNRAVKPGVLPEKPIILVSTMGDDKTRGDSHGYIGLGQEIAHRLGGSYHYVDENVLKTHYPAERVYDSFSLFFQDIGSPDIIFSRNFSWQEPLRKQAPDKSPFIINDFNESLCSDLRKTQTYELVAHHLTPALLQEEGARFSADYPDLKGSLIALIMADNKAGGLVATLDPSIQSMENAHIFICSSRRTETERYQEVFNALQRRIINLDAENRITLSGYDFNGDMEDDVHNPYIGLLAKADHILICGYSRSIVSESLVTGKTIHLIHDDSSYKELIRRKDIRILSPFSTACLQTDSIPPFNPTGIIADKIIADYRRKELRKMGLMHRINTFLMGP